ncbi:MAG: hypothetical protein FI737_01675 [SAR202 cluster bacterium]|jgi:hypothetical protein|nr:hypothetical protein [Dehalococcoidia bacterium]MQF87785.1 hypothetical protein [SAR202 cluster bacterium]|tara:strand:+ start:517 stop:807 length:291 start_codon:yes stop_codon:yes gene_type:complete
MKDVYPEFADNVDFYAIGQSPFESIDQLESYRINESYPWPVAEVDPNILRSLRVLQQSTKIALDHQGIITYRGGYADGGADKWRKVFSNLVERAGG